MQNNIILYICIIIFIVGFGFFIKQNKYKEGMASNTNYRCPNLLIQNGSMFYLQNTRLKTVPGVNPIVFNNLEEYNDFLKWQRSVGIFCPVLFLQKGYNTQGEEEYKIRPSVTEQQGFLPPTKTIYPQSLLLKDASRDDSPYNKNGYPSFDSHNQDIGRHTVLDNMNDYKNNDLFPLSSDYATNPNWNPELAEKHIAQGYYSNNNVQIYIP